MACSMIGVLYMYFFLKNLTFKKIFSPKFNLIQCVVCVSLCRCRLLNMQCCSLLVITSIGVLSASGREYTNLRCILR